jgi:very-short-patch-repair endonuclease
MAAMADVRKVRHAIGGKHCPRPDERAIGELAGRQHGVASRRQLLDLGFGRRAIEVRLATGRLHPVHRGVFAVGHAALTGLGRWMAAVLACGPNSLLSHRSGGTLLGIYTTATLAVDVSRPGGGASRPGIHLHRTRQFDSADRFIWQGIPVTAPARTLLDLAEVVSRKQLQRAFEQAQRLKMLDPKAVRACLERNPGRHGQAPLRAILAGAFEPQFTRSELERILLEISRATGLHAPRMNVIVCGFEVDAEWEEQKLVVELDGYAWHSDPAAFEEDRRRDAKLQLAGYMVLRITYRRLRYETGAVIELIRRALARSA